MAHDVITGRRLLPRIGHDDPDGAEMRAEADHACCEEVRSRPDLVPAEENERQEARLQKEGENALGRQCAAEDVADKAGVGRPVGSKLELHD